MAFAARRAFEMPPRLIERHAGAPGGRVARLGAVALLLPGSGCAPGAPSLVLFGAYFPAWLACAVIGMAAAGVARMLMVVLGVSQKLPYPLLVCTSVGTATAVLTGLWWFAL